MSPEAQHPWLISLWRMDKLTHGIPSHSSLTHTPKTMNEFHGFRSDSHGHPEVTARGQTDRRSGLSSLKSTQQSLLGLAFFYFCWVFCFAFLLTRLLFSFWWLFFFNARKKKDRKSKQLSTHAKKKPRHWIKSFKTQSMPYWFHVKTRLVLNAKYLDTICKTRQT